MVEPAGHIPLHKKYQQILFFSFFFFFTKCLPIEVRPRESSDNLVYLDVITLMCGSTGSCEQPDGNVVLEVVSTGSGDGHLLLINKVKHTHDH